MQKLKKIVVALLISVLSLNIASVSAINTEGTPVQLPSDVKDGVMSNPDGYEPVKTRGDGYDMRWTIENGIKVMYDGVGNKFGNGESKKVIDVSSYNRTVNWPVVKSGGVDGAILRATSYATGYIGEDTQFSNNVSGCKNAQVPFGVYLYSYSTNPQDALYEANYLINILRTNGVTPNDLSYPVYLDLEGNNYTSGVSVAMYEQIVNTFINQMESAGYKTHVYSYKSYLMNNLNSPKIHQYVSWVAQYGLQLTFNNPYYSGMNGWQYQSNGRVDGVNGEVDVNCFSGGIYKDITYKAHVQEIGWQLPQGDGEMSGTLGQAKRLEALSISLPSPSYNGSVQYQTHIQDIGWQDWKSDGQISGTSGANKRIEAMKIQLTGEMANKFDIYYRVHAQNVGWMDWASNGQATGTAGYGYRLEAMQIKLVPKGTSAPGPTTNIFKQTFIGYQTHVQEKGWQGFANDGETSGTIGRALRLEGIIIGLQNQLYTGDIQYRTHVQNIGWQNWTTYGQMAGTTGKGLRLEAIEVRLTGEMANQYDVFYRTHCQNYGWLGWTKNGTTSGTVGKQLRLEAIQIVLVAKGSAAPGSTSRPFIQE